MARAKRTARADARRRYRAEHAEIEGTTEAGEATTTAAAAGPTAAKAAPSATGQARVGVATAFRQSFRPLDIRADIAALPWLAIHTKALWLPLLLIVGSTVVIAFTGGTNLVGQFMFAYFIQTPAIGGVFLAGFLAPRASWLLGVLVGLASALCYAVIILFFPTTVAATTPTTSQATDAIVAALVLSPTMGAFFAAAAAWYRRFLQLSNPNRRQQQSKAKGNDGRTRSSGQKAGARR
uniref:Uncharacterized protein n=1 Tax=uncultured bacterium 148 TaxID=698380 RepID=E3T6N6_9BACT|nr:hypothetical protein [uncultured bacterium 148]